MDYKGTKCSNCFLYLEKTQYTSGQLKKSAKKRKCITCTRTATVDSQSMLNILCKWLRENDAVISNIDIIAYTPEYRGVVARNRFKKGEKVVRIPFKCIISLFESRNTKSGKILSKHGFNSHNILAIRLLEEKYDPNSFFQPYIDTLPTKFESVPLFYGEKYLDMLKGCFVLDMIKAKIYMLHANYERIKNLLKLKYTFHEYVWARTVIITRIFGYKRMGFSDSGLVPVADMLNHDAKPNTSWGFSEHNETFDVVAKKWILKGCNILDSYGPKCNTRYMVNYGFTLKNNDDNNQCALFLPTKGFSEKKIKLLGEPSNYDDGYSHYPVLIENELENKVVEEEYSRFQFPTIQNVETSSQKYARKVLWFSRISVCEEDALPVKKDINKPISVENEIKALKYLGKYAKERLNEFREGIEEDEKCILDVEEFTKEYNIINTRLSEKRVLKYYVDLAEIVSGKNPTKTLRNNERMSAYYNIYWKKLK